MFVGWFGWVFIKELFLYEIMDIYSMCFKSITDDIIISEYIGKILHFLAIVLLVYINQYHKSPNKLYQNIKNFN